MTHATISKIGNTVAIINPLLMLSLDLPAISPTSVGPAVQPKSPARASSAKSAVPPRAKLLLARLKVPGHNTPTERPQSPHPVRAKTGLEQSAEIKYDAMHKTPLPIISLFKDMCFSIFALTTLEVPISNENIHGPARSPIVFDTFNPLSANADAH